jgi:hypothetical protein
MRVAAKPPKVTSVVEGYAAAPTTRPACNAGEEPASPDPMPSVAWAWGMTMGFLVIRLGKDSLPDIARFTNSATAAPFNFEFTCTQVEQAISPGDYAFIYLGSDNNKGIETAWKQGLRGIARVADLVRGGGFNDENTFSLDVISVFSKSLDQFDFLERSATLYKYFSQYPIIGIKSSRNNAAQKVRDDPRENTSALLTAIRLLYPDLVDDLTKNAPDLLELLEFIPTSEAASDGSISASEDDPYLKAVRQAITERNELNFLFLGPPGTGKTWHAHSIANALTNANGHRIALLQFHPSIAYDDFVEGYSPTLSSDQTSIKYEIRPKHFLNLCEAARADAGNLYVMVIDEISRGDPSRVFGEMLTYIEPQYRDRTFALAYSGRPYRVPPNVVILATANPYDRSVGEMDDAFLRRFEMLEFKPDRAVLDARLIKNEMPDAGRQKVLHFFDTINASVPNGLGHAYFLNLKTEADAVRLWNSKLHFMVRRMLQYEQDKITEIEQKLVDLFSEHAGAEDQVGEANENNGQ